jgi:hypothetical protein
VFNSSLERKPSLQLRKTMKELTVGRTSPFWKESLGGAFPP